MVYDNFYNSTLTFFLPLVMKNSVRITNFCKLSKVKFDKSYSNSQGILCKVNSVLNIENFGFI
jgi:hypothetical protein